MEAAPPRWWRPGRSDRALAKLCLRAHGGAILGRESKDFRRSGRRRPAAPRRQSSPMSEQKARAICVGEVLIELARGADGRFALSCGGDTFNTAVYLARAGIDVALAPAL